jgi:hypothetical protein
MKHKYRNQRNSVDHGFFEICVSFFCLLSWIIQSPSFQVIRTPLLSETQIYLLRMMSDAFRPAKRIYIKFSYIFCLPNYFPLKLVRIPPLKPPPPSTSFRKGGKKSVVFAVWTVKVYTLSGVGVTYKTGFWIGWLDSLHLLLSRGSGLQAVER